METAPSWGRLIPTTDLIDEHGRGSDVAFFFEDNGEKKNKQGTVMFSPLPSSIRSRIAPPLNLFLPVLSGLRVVSRLFRDSAEIIFASSVRSRTVHPSVR